MRFAPLFAAGSLLCVLATAASAQNQNPICIANPVAAQQCTGNATQFQLDASQSFDPDGDPITFEWVSCPGSTLDDFTSPTPILTLDTSTTCDRSCGVRLFVRDNEGGVGLCRIFVKSFAPVCEVPSCIRANFNGTAIPATRVIWFNSIVKVTGGATDVTVTGGHITFTVNSTVYSLPVPDNHITFSSVATQATTTFDNVANRWETVVPSSYSGNVFMAGLPYPLATGLPGGIKNVEWCTDFATSTAGASFQWKWAAAVYTNFTTNMNAIGVKPIDGGNNNPYPNSDHAGTPENFKTFVVGGARGGGGSNFTGSYSGTASAACP